MFKIVIPLAFHNLVAMLRQAKPLVTAAFHNRLSMTAPAFYWWMPQLRDCNESHMVFRWRHCLGLRTMDCVSTVTGTALESQYRWFSTLQVLPGESLFSSWTLLSTKPSKRGS